MTDKTDLMLEMVKALVRQGTTTRFDGIIVWTLCKYCGRSGWVSEGKSGYPMTHDQNCFIELAQEWIKLHTEPEDLL